MSGEVERNTAVPRTRCTGRRRLDEHVERQRILLEPLPHQRPAGRPGGQDHEDHRRDDQREPAAVGDLGDVRREEDAVDRRNRPMVSVASTRFHFHTWKIRTASISVVMIIVPLTEMP